MDSKVLILILFLMSVAWADVTDVNDEERDEKVKRGMDVAKDSLYKILFGEPKGQGYKDLFLDTNYNLIDYLSTLEQHITVDDLLLIFFQSLIILCANKRFDLIPQDFNGNSYLKISFSTFISQRVLEIFSCFKEKHPAFDDFVKELSSLSSILASKGTKGITLRTLQKFFKSM